MPSAISYYNQTAGKPHLLFSDDPKKQMLFHVFLCEELALVSPVPCYFAEVVLALAVLEVVVVVFSVAVLNAVMTHRLSILSWVLCSNTMSRRVARFPGTLRAFNVSRSKIPLRHFFQKHVPWLAGNGGSKRK